MFSIFLVVVIFFILSLIAVVSIVLYFKCQKKKERERNNNYGNRPVGVVSAIELPFHDAVNMRNANEPGFEASYENKSNMVNVDDLETH